MKKLTYEYVKNGIESVEGYKLLSDVYVNANTNLKVKHECEHEYTVKFNNFQQGKRCTVCSTKHRADKQRLSFEYVKNEIESVKGYKLLSDNYVNNRTKLKVKHEECGNEYEVTFAQFQRGNRCPKCSTKQAADKMRLSFDYVKNEIEKIKDYKLLSDEYVSAHTKLKVKHVICGHEYEVTFGNFQQGTRCPVCGKKQSADKQKLSFEYVKSEIEKIEGYKLLSNEYINNNTKLKVKHDIEKCGYGYGVEFSNFKNGQRCPKCAREQTASKWEQEVAGFVEEISGKYDGFERNNRDQIFNYKTGYFLELDILLRERKKAVECNDDYYHSQPYQKEKDEMKVKQCKELGIDLLIIYERDWKYKREKCKEMIYNFLA